MRFHGRDLACIAGVPLDDLASNQAADGLQAEQLLAVGRFVVLPIAMTEVHAILLCV